MSKRQFSVSQINRYIKNVFEDEYVLMDITVEGQLAECSIVNNNLYATIKDEESSLRVVQFGTSLSLTVGNTVLVVGAVRYYSKQGQVQMVAAAIIDSGLSINQTRLDQLKLKLQQEGLFDSRNKVPLPHRVKRIALITSIEGAVVHDFVSVANKKNKTIDIIVCPVRVQGEGSVDSIVWAVQALNRLDNIDVVVIMRGGGSNVDLDIFNQEVLVRAVAQSKYATVSAIGHELDYTLCDLVATKRAGTPSMAAEMIVPDIKDSYAEIYRCMYGIYAAVDRRLRSKSSDTIGLVNQVHHMAALKVKSFRPKVAVLLQAIFNVLSNMHNSIRQSLFNMTQRMHDNNPTKLIQQGYVKIEKAGQTLYSVSQLQQGDSVRLFLQDGQVYATIDSIYEKE